MNEKKLDIKWQGSDTITDDSEAVINRFKKFAPEYDKAVEEWGYRAPDIASNLVEKYLPKAARIVDAGCGTGLGGEVLKTRGYTQLTGFDISPDLLSLADSKQAYLMLNVIDMLNQPYPYLTNYFDGLICIGVLSFFSSISPLIAEFRRIVKDGGLLFLTLRDDLYINYQQNELFEKLIDSGALELLEVIKNQPYLPAHKDYCENIRISYYAYRVLHSRSDIIQ